MLCACDLPERPELLGRYRTRDGAVSLTFEPGRRYRFRHGPFDISVSGSYHLADARRLILHEPLQRAGEAGGRPLLLRQRDELKWVHADGKVVRLFRQRDADDGPAPLTGELLLETEAERDDENPKSEDALAESGEGAESETDADIPEEDRDTLPPEIP